MRSLRAQIAVSLIAVAALSACGGQSSSSQTSSASAGRLSTVGSTTSATHKRAARRRHRPHSPHRPALAQRPAVLPVSHASSTVVQPQPSPGTCHAKGSGKFSEPDSSCTPGARNPAVAQSTIGQTICVSGYSESVRPAEHITAKEKLASMAAYGDSGSPSEYEYDHLVSLELGGAPNDPRNLWPEPGTSPNPKDSIENALHRLVCSGQMPLAQAQKILATGWIAYYRSHGFGSGEPSASGQSAPPAASAPSSSGGPDKPISEINCSDFPTHAAAQRWFNEHGGSSSNDVAGLDGDHDGLACESLP